MNNADRIMRPHFAPLLIVIGHHFKLRHDGRGSKPARVWIEEVRRVEKASGCKYNP